MERRGKSEGKRLLGKPRHRWMDNIKMDPREIGWDGMYCIDLAVGDNESSDSTKYWEVFE
jgi:hypothetical protein